MLSQALYFGEAGGNRVLQADRGSHDAGYGITARLEYRETGPGLGGEAVFYALFVGLTWTMPATVLVTPIIMGTDEAGQSFERELETQEVVLEALAARRSAQFQFGLSDPLMVGGVERARCAVRGALFRTRLEAEVVDENDLIFDGVGVEMEVVRDSLGTQNPNPAPSS